MWEKGFKHKNYILNQKTKDYLTFKGDINITKLNIIINKNESTD